MHRATVTIPSELEEKLEHFIAAQPAPPSLAAVVGVALRRLLDPAEEAVVLPINRVLANRAAIRRAASRNRIRSISLFGSVARGEGRADSDVDFLVEVEEGATLFDLARLRAELEELLDAAVDVVPQGGLERDELAEVLAEAIRL